MKKLAKLRSKITDLFIIFLLNAALIWGSFIIVEAVFTGCIRNRKRNDEFYCYSDSPGMFLFTMTGHVIGMVLGVVLIVLLYELFYGSKNKNIAEKTIITVEDIVEEVRQKANIPESDMIQKMRREERITSNDDITIIRNEKN